VINKLKKPKSFDNGGITRLPMPPSSPNVPAVYNREPLLSVKGLQQRYASLPGAIRTPISKTGKFLGLRNPYILSLYGLSAAAQNPTISNFFSNFPGSDFDREYAERMAKEAGPAIRAPGTLAGSPNTPSIDYLDSVNISQDAPVKSQLEKDFPGMSGSEIIEQINTSEQNSGIEIKPDAVPNVINEEIEKNQLTGLDVKPNGKDPTDPGVVVDVTEETETIDDIPNDVVVNEQKNRDDQSLKAKQFFFENMDTFFSDNPQKSALALQLDNAVDDIMGDDKRSNKLLLLQLASNLLTGRTDQPGFKGFLDVLGKAGQNVIPMALALEDERRKDETELKKAMLGNMKKDKNLKFSPDNKLIRVPIDGEMKTFRGRTSEEGNVQIKVPGGYIDVSNKMYTIMNAPEADDIERVNKQIAIKANALRGINNALELTINDPDLIGSKGSLAEFVLAGKDIFAQYFGETSFEKLNKEYRDQKEQYNTDINKRLEAGEISTDEAKAELEAGKSYFDKIKKELGTVNSSESDTLRKQASLRAIELLTSYALANILKDKDRLAVRDIERAEKLTGQFGFFKSPTKVISQYLVIKKELEESIRKDLGVAESIGIMSDQIFGYDKIIDLSKQKEMSQLKGFEKNLSQIIDNSAGDLDQISDVLFGDMKIVGDN
tara:strand:+ start:2673 stop:4658 length:1986 start_codon:yes stop_codon:yes gene_type:complete